MKILLNAEPISLPEFVHSKDRIPEPFVASKDYDTFWVARGPKGEMLYKSAAGKKVKGKAPSYVTFQLEDAKQFRTRKACVKDESLFFFKLKPVAIRVKKAAA